MASKLAGLNTYGLCEWLQKKGINDFVSHIQAWNYDGQQLVALTEDQLCSLEISEASRKKLLKVIYPHSTAMSGNSGLLSRFRKKQDQTGANGGGGADTYDDDDDEQWDDDEFDDGEMDPAPSHVNGLAHAHATQVSSALPAFTASPMGPRSSSMSSPCRPEFRGSASSSIASGYNGAVNSELGFKRTSSVGARQVGSSGLTNQDYYNPTMDRYSAESMLQQAQVDGSFTVRNSSKVPGEYSMSLLYKGYVRHLRIRHRQDNTFALGEAKPGEKFFSSVADLISFHKTDPINLQSGGYTVLTYAYR